MNEALSDPKDQKDPEDTINDALQRGWKPAKCFPMPVISHLPQLRKTKHWCFSGNVQGRGQNKAQTFHSTP
jgi:hypothetical protein